MARHEKTVPLFALASSTLESLRASTRSVRIRAEIDAVLADRLRAMQNYVVARALREEDDE